jgi:hypothetical protein
MFGRFFGVIGLPLVILLLLMAVAFGTAGPFFALVIAGIAGVVMLVAYGIRRGNAQVSTPGEPGGAGRPSGAPVAGEGSGSPLSASGRSPE